MLVLDAKTSGTWEWACLLLAKGGMITVFTGLVSTVELCFYYGTGTAIVLCRPMIYRNRK